MALYERYLVVRPSGIPGAGQGLFTEVEIPKGARLVEYKGEVKSWDAVRFDTANAYIYFLKPNLVIDARDQPKALARYVNDADGLTKAKGHRNNARFVADGNRVFIETLRHIQPGEEIFVGYGRQYWDTVRRNGKL